MAEWLTYAEFETLGGDKAKVSTDDKFKGLLITAQQKLSVETQGFYMTPEELENDDITFRKTRYKEALTQQINFYADTKATTAAQMANKPVSQSIGDTSVSYDARSKTASGALSTTSPEALELLKDTGLLYRGAKLWRHY